MEAELLQPLDDRLELLPELNAGREVGTDVDPVGQLLWRELLNAVGDPAGDLSEVTLREQAGPLL